MITLILGLTDPIITIQVAPKNEATKFHSSHLQNQVVNCITLYASLCHKFDEYRVYSCIQNQTVLCVLKIMLVHAL